MRRVLLTVPILLAGCATVRGWFGGSPAETRPAPPEPPRTAKVPPPAEPAKAGRSSDDIRRELRSIADDAKAGRIGVKDAKNRLKKLGEELDTVLAAEARKAGRNADLASVLARIEDLGRRLDELSERLESTERRLDALERR